MRYCTNQQGVLGLLGTETYINYYNTMQYMFDRNMYRVELDRSTVASNSEQVKSWKDSGKMPARDEP